MNTQADKADIRWGYGFNQWKQGWQGFARVDDHVRAFKATSAAGFRRIELTAFSGPWDPVGRPESITINFGSVRKFGLMLQDWGIDRITSVFLDVGQMSFEDLHFVRKQQGAVLGAFEAWLLTRGMRTLFVRFERQSANAMALARHFEGHPKLERVIYPGLESHPGHAVAKRQMTGGFGGMLSILVKGSMEEGRRVAGAVKVFYPATSLGGVESLIEHRKTVEAPDSPIPVNLIRISIGIEHVSDLIADLEQALESI